MAQLQLYANCRKYEDCKGCQDFSQTRMKCRFLLSMLGIKDCGDTTAKKEAEK